MKKVLTYGTFDLFHIGHLNILRRAKALGDYLVVAVSTDEFNELKGKSAYCPYEERKAIVESIKFVDEVIPETDWNQKVNDVVNNNIDVVVMGDDWKDNPRFEYLREYCEVVYLPRTEDISSSKIKSDLNKYSVQ